MKQFNVKEGLSIRILSKKTMQIYVKGEEKEFVLWGMIPIDHMSQTNFSITFSRKCE